MVNILEKINEFIEKIRDKIPVPIYQKIINIKEAYLRDYPLFTTFLTNEFDESQEDLTPDQNIQLASIYLREIFPKFTESCENFQLSDIYEELVQIISKINLKDLSHLYQTFINFQTTLAQTFSTKNSLPHSLYEINTINTIFTILFKQQLEQKINPLINSEDLESTIIKFLNEPDIEIHLNRAEEFIKQKVSQPLNIASIEANLWEDYAHNIIQYYEGMKIYAIMFCNIFDIIFYDQPFSEREFKKRYVKNLYNEILNPEKFKGKKKRKVGLFVYFSKLSDFPILKKFLQYLYIDLRQLRNTFSHNPNHRDLIQNDSTVQQKILNFHEDIEFFQLFPLYFPPFLLLQIIERQSSME